MRGGLRVFGLILAALVPSFVIAALWLGLGSPAGQAPTISAQEQDTGVPSAVLTSAGRIEAVGGSPASISIALDGTDGVPSRSIIALKGLPPGSNLSEGRPYGDSEWTLKPDQIGDLNLILPAGAQGEFRLSIALIAPDDRVIAEAETLLVVAPPPPPPVAVEEETDTAPPNEEAAAAAPAPEGQATAALTGQETMETAPAGPGQATEGDGAPPPQEQPGTREAAVTPSANNHASQAQPIEAATAGLSTVEPSVFVNMREEPSSSSPVLGVIAKGAELPVLDRRRGWVQVADPETGKRGWIYSGLLVGEAKTNHKVRRVAPAETEAKSESFWGRVGRWLSPSQEN